MSICLDSVSLSHDNQSWHVINTNTTYTLGIHRRTVLSRDAEATRCPEGEKETDITASYKTHIVALLLHNQHKMCLYMIANQITQDIPCGLQIGMLSFVA